MTVKTFLQNGFSFFLIESIPLTFSNVILQHAHQNTLMDTVTEAMSCATGFRLIMLHFNKSHAKKVGNLWSKVIHFEMVFIGQES